jgi:predicted alpha/beta superfamily hydrolase
MSASNQAVVDQFDLPHPSGDGVFQISVSRAPVFDVDARTIPVMFVMDADFEFAVAAEIARFKGVGGMLPAPMVVGVGYGVTDLATFSRLRTADLTTPLSAANRAALGDKMSAAFGDKDGGADGLLDFILEVLTPEILRRYPEASADNHALFGHSLGGLFATYALLTRPEAFAVFLPVSPALYWNSFAVLEHLPAFAEKLKATERKPRVLLSCGGCEQDPPAALPEGATMTLAEAQAMIAACRMIDTMQEFAVALRDAGLTDVTSVVFDGEGHVNVIPGAMMRAVTFAVPDPE